MVKHKTWSFEWDSIGSKLVVTVQFKDDYGDGVILIALFEVVGLSRIWCKEQNNRFANWIHTINCHFSLASVMGEQSPNGRKNLQSKFRSKSSSFALFGPLGQVGTWWKVHSRHFIIREAPRVLKNFGCDLDVTESYECLITRQSIFSSFFSNTRFIINLMRRSY